MEGAWRAILARYGQPAVLCRAGEEIAVRAVIQPVLEERGDQREPTPLGQAVRERFLYMGPAQKELDLDTVVRWQDRQLRVRRAHLAGAPVCPYWWAVLCPRDEVEP